MILRFLRWLGVKRPYWDIYGSDGTLYMGRWWLLGGSARIRDDDDRRRSTPWSWKRGRLDALVGRFFAVRLHHIAREDRARDLHIHPCAFISVIVGGWYVERLPRSQSQDPGLDTTDYVDVLRLPGSIARRRATDRHTIVRVSPGGAWTLFLMGKKERQGDWGFWTPAGFVKARDYGSLP